MFVIVGIFSLYSFPSNEYSNLASLGFVLILVNALCACPSYTPSYGIASNSIVPFLTVATCITLFSAYSPFAALLTIILAFPATVSGFSVIVFPSIDAVAMFEASELTVSSPLDVLFVTSNVPLFGYVYVPFFEDIVKSSAFAIPSYIISTSPFSLSFTKNLYSSFTIISAFFSSTFSLELKL